MTDRPTPSPGLAFEARLASAFAAYADRAPVDVDAVTLTAAVATRAASSRSALVGARRYLVPVLLGLLLVALAAGVVLVGSRLLDRRPDADTPQQPAIVAPSSAPSAAPVAEPSIQPTRQPDPSERPPADQPCPAMVQLGQVENNTDPIPAVGRVTGNGDLLVRTMPGAGGGPDIGRYDPSQSPPATVGYIDGVELPFQSAVISSSIDPAGRLVASRDGRAVAFEAGDFGQAGCGDPIVVPAGNGYRRPFLGRAFEMVSDLAWAPDGSALYGIRRPTLDALGQPYSDFVGPATMLRWDTATGEVTELPAGCEDCSKIFVSPDGTHLAAESAGTIKVYDTRGRWRDLVAGYDLAGWADDGSVVVNEDGAGRRVTLDGRVAAQWDVPCCHFSFHGPLSPDGTTVAAVTVDNDVVHRSVTLLDVRDGTSRAIWSAPAVKDCSGLSRNDPGCQPVPHPTPNTTNGLTGSARIVAWAPDSSAVLLLDMDPDSTAATLRVVPVDGSGARSPVTVEDPALSETLDWSPSIVWLPATAP